MVRLLRHRQTKGADHGYAQPIATASHPDSTDYGLSFIPNADAHRYISCWGTPSSRCGHNRPEAGTLEISG